MEEQMTLPDWFDRSKFLEPFKTKSTIELYKHFGCKNATSFSNMMKKYFPNKPSRMAYRDYVLELLEGEEGD